MNRLLQKKEQQKKRKGVPEEHFVLLGNPVCRPISATTTPISGDAAGHGAFIKVRRGQCRMSFVHSNSPLAQP